MTIEQAREKIEELKDKPSLTTQERETFIKALQVVGNAWAKV